MSGEYVFTPLSPGRPADFPRVSASDQVARDADAQRIVAGEFDQDMPEENRAALEREYSQRFKADPPAPAAWTFTPVGEAKAATTGKAEGYKFTPVEPEKPSVMRTVMLNNPGTAAGETGANLASQMVALPVAGLAGLGALASKALGLTDKEPADVVRSVGEALTYQPRGEMGKAATEAVMYPFQKLAEVGTAAGDKVLAVTGSPAAATAVDTAINSVPMLIGMKGKPKVAAEQSIVKLDPAHGPLSRAVLSTREAANPVAEPASPPVPVANSAPTVQPPPKQFPVDPIAQAADDANKSGLLVPLAEGEQLPEVAKNGTTNKTPTAPAEYRNMDSVSGGVQRLAGDAEALPQSGEQGLSAMGRAGNNDLSAMGELQELPGRHGAEAITGVELGPDRQQQGVLAGELPLGDDQAAAAKSPQQSAPGYGQSADNTGGSGGAIWDHQSLPETTAGSRRRPGERIGSGEIHESTGTADLLSGGKSNPVAMGEEIGRPTSHTTNSHESGQVTGGSIDAGKTSAGAPMQTETFGTLRQDHEPAGMGEGIGDSGKYTEPTGTVRNALGEGVDAGKNAEAARIDEAAHRSATSPLNDLPQPSKAQIAAGNYQKGNVKLHGLDISIENPRGSVRSGIGRDGVAWQTELKNHYGYIRDTVGRDKDHLDVFLGDKPKSQKAFVIDQVTPETGAFDEHKIILNAETPAEARAIYQANYDPGWKGLGAMVEMSVPELKSWIRSGKTKAPLAFGKNRPKYGARVKTEVVAGNPIEARPAELPQVNIPDPLRQEHEPVRADDGYQAAHLDGTPGDAIDAGTPENLAATGNAYVGTIRDLPTAMEPAAVNPLRREDVLAPLIKALNVPIYEGRIKNPKIAGLYAPGKEMVRIKKPADLETAAHEMAHLLDDRIPEIRATYKNDKAIREELRSVSYDKDKINEGFAEFVRLWATQPEKAQALTPKAYAWFENFLDSHQYGPALRQAQADMTAWFSQDALHRAQSKIGKPTIANDVLGGFWGHFRQSVSDDLHGIYRMERDLAGKINTAGAYETSRLTRAASSITDGAIRYGRPVRKADGSFTFEGKGLEEILKPVSDRLDDYLLYAVGRSASELMGQGREHLFTPAEVDAMLKLKQPDFERAFMEYQAWNKGIIDFAEAHGVINPAARSMWQRQAYMPFHRVGQPGEGRIKPGEWSGIKALTGGTENLRDILGNVTGNASMLLTKALQNEARLKIAELADTERGGGRFMVKIPAESRPVKIATEQVVDAVLKSLGLDGARTPAMQKLAKFIEEQIRKSPGQFEFMLGNQSPAGHNVVAVLKGGKPEYYEVADPLLYRALSALDRPHQPWLIKWLVLPKRVGQMTVTLTPDFMVANIARDTLMGAVMSRAGFRPVMDSLIGMRLRLTNDPLYKDYIANGGGLSSQFIDEGRFRHHLEKFYGRQGIDYRTVLDAPDKVLSFVETLADAFEASTRLGEYKQAIENGEHPRHAAYLGREVSTDFAMRGDNQALGFLYDTVMFLRPMVESIDRLVRGGLHDPNAKGIAIKTGMLALSSTALYLLNRDDPRYADAPEWDRDAHWHFFVGDQHFRWPKIWEIGAISSIAERTTEKTMQADPLGLGRDIARILSQTFSVNLMPQAIAPIYEQAANRNGFTNAPIETPGMEGMQPFLRAKPGTSEILKAAGMATMNLPEWAQVTPTRAEALLRGYFNTWALYGLQMADAALYGDKLPEKRLDQYPVLRRFYEDQPAIRTKYETMFYDLLGEASRLHGTLRALDKMGHPELADEKEKEPLATKAAQLERASKRISVIDRDMQAVRRQPISPQEKRQQLDSLLVERNALMKATVLDVRPE